MVSVFLGLALLCGAGLSQPQPQPQPQSQQQQPPPQPCCLPNKLTTTLTQTETAASDKIRIINVAIDYDRGMQSNIFMQFDTSTKQTNETARTIIDQQKKTTFTIMGEKCTSTPLTDPAVAHDRCFLANAEYLGSSYIGPAGVLDYHAWRMSSSNMSVTMVVSAQGCVPILEGFDGIFPPTPERMQSVTFWTGFEPEIRDPSVFNIPRSCHPPETSTGK